MSYPTGNSFPPRFQPQTAPFSPYGAPSFPAAPALGNFSRPAFPPASPMGPQPAGLGLPQSGFSQPTPQAGQPQDAFSQAAAQPDGAQGFGDKNTTLSDGSGSAIFNWKTLTATAAAAAAIYFGYRHFNKPAEEVSEKFLSGAEHKVKEMIKKAYGDLDEIHPEFQNKLGIGKVSEENAQEAHKLVAEPLDTLKKLTDYTLSEELKNAYNNYVNAFKAPEVGTEITEKTKETAAENFKKTSKTFGEKLDEALKPPSTATPGAEHTTENAGQAADTAAEGSTPQAGNPEQAPAQATKPKPTPTTPSTQEQQPVVPQETTPAPAKQPVDQRDTKAPEPEKQPINQPAGPGLAHQRLARAKQAAQQLRAALPNEASITTDIQDGKGISNRVRAKKNFATAQKNLAAYLDAPNRITAGKATQAVSRGQLASANAEQYAKEVQENLNSFKDSRESLQIAEENLIKQSQKKAEKYTQELNDFASEALASAGKEAPKPQEKPSLFQRTKTAFSLS